MSRIVTGLTTHYGFDRESDDIRYWTLHMGVDEEHMKVGPEAVRKYAVSDQQQEVVRQSVQKTLDQFWLAFDGIKRFFDLEPSWTRTPYTPPGATGPPADTPIERSNPSGTTTMSMIDLSRVIYDGMPKIPVLPDVHVQRFFEIVTEV